MTDQTAARTEISARLMAVAQHTIVAEWICCEPLDPKHDLCAQGYATREMTRALLVDDPEASVTAAPLLDAVMGLLPAVPVPPPVDQTAGRGFRAVFTVTVETRKDGDYYFDHADLVRNVVPWLEGALEDEWPDPYEYAGS